VDRNVPEQEKRIEEELAARLCRNPDPFPFEVAGLRDASGSQGYNFVM
jgi:hypothetical protein